MGKASFHGKELVGNIGHYGMAYATHGRVTAALRNIREFSASVPGLENMTKYLEMVFSGVKGGKQFPFRYIKLVDTPVPLRSRNMYLTSLS